MKVWASRYRATVLPAPSFYACLGTWPSPTDEDRAFLLPVHFILFSKMVDFFGSVLFLLCHLILSCFLHQHYHPIKSLTLLCTLHFYGSTKMLTLPISSHFDRTSFIWKKRILFSSAHSTKLVSHVNLE